VKIWGLFTCLKDTFGNQTDEILAVAAYMICEDNAMDGIDDFQERNLIPELNKLFTSQSCIRLFLVY
jgi:hypothetical protein